ncbi:mechanosensitive ion channel family protein [Litorimonas sp. WD9-15]|uniref:mechanosensitive ion channel family protein n=1 Tax=Litorimonas sp. WD9-15 TaxID=3418716 RepID=UPI003CFC9336
MNSDVMEARLREALEQVLIWVQSPAFLAQVGAVIAALILAPLLARFIRKGIFLFRDAPAEDAKLLPARQIIFKAGNFLRAVMLVGLLAIFAAILKAVPMLGQDWLVKLAQSLALVFLIYRAIKTFVADPLFQKLATWTLIPLGLIMVLGYGDDLSAFLSGTTVFKMGEADITLMSLIRLGIFGALFFWLGGISNTRGQAAIRGQESLDSGVREIVAKLFQIILFAVLTVLVLGAAGIPLSGLVVVFSAVALGIGFGLQPIAANFVSGLIILFDRSVRVGDFVVLPDGQEGFVEAINMRNTVVETTDGKDIMVPNTKFTEEAYENWTHKDPRQRYEVHFMVSYTTDLDALEDMLIPEVLKHPQVLREPEMPDLEFRSFGENGVNMAIEFWCEGVDDGPNKFTSDVNFIVWRTLRDNGVEIPFPQRVVHTK